MIEAYRNAIPNAMLDGRPLIAALLIDGIASSSGGVIGEASVGCVEHGTLPNDALREPAFPRADVSEANVGCVEHGTLPNDALREPAFPMAEVSEV